MDELSDLLDEIDEHLLCDSPIPAELAARFLCAVSATELQAMVEVLSHHLPTNPEGPEDR